MLFVLIFLFGLAVSIYFYLVNRNNFFKSLGIPGPAPKIFFGNVYETSMNENQPKQLARWTEEYGKTYGVFKGGTPVLVTSNLDILYDVFVKKFTYFHSRAENPLMDEDKRTETDVFIARGLRWKRLRTIANPAFSVMNLREMIPTMQDSIDHFLELIQENPEGKSFDIFPLFKGLTLDVIGRVALGQEESNQNSDSNPWFQSFTETADTPVGFGANRLYFIALLLPELKSLWVKLAELKLYLRQTFTKTSEVQVVEKLKALIRERRENREIFSQCILFLIAGFETTATTLAYATYLLASNPEIQEKLQQEIDEVCETEDEISYDKIQKLTYLNNVIKETLRMYPLAAFTQRRRAMKSCQAGDHFIAEGTEISADVWSIHYDKDIWGLDAQQFRPERFEDEVTKRHPMAWIPFGAGPRMCIGMRLALLEDKLVLVNVLRRYNIKACAETRVSKWDPNARACCDTNKLSGPGTVSPGKVVIVLEPRK